MQTGAGRATEISVVSLITVPRTEPIDTPKPDAEAAASDAAKEARRIGKTYGVKVKPVVERVRDPFSASPRSSRMGSSAWRSWA